MWVFVVTNFFKLLLRNLYYIFSTALHHWSVFNFKCIFKSLEVFSNAKLFQKLALWHQNRGSYNIYCVNICEKVFGLCVKRWISFCRQSNSLGIRLGVRCGLGCSDFPIRWCHSVDVRQRERRDLLQGEKNSARQWLESLVAA